MECNIHSEPFPYMALKRCFSSDSETELPLDTKKSNFQTTPVKMTEFEGNKTLLNTMDTTSEQIERNKVIDAIKLEAPAWFTNVFNFWLRDLDYLRSHTAGVDTCNQKCDNSKDIKDLQKRVHDLELENRELHDHVNRLENYSRKDKLIIKGITETGPSEDTLDVVMKFFINDLELVDAEKIIISNAHRLGKPPYLVTGPVRAPKDIIIRFQSALDRSKVRSNRFNLNRLTALTSRAQGYS